MSLNHHQYSEIKLPQKPPFDLYESVYGDVLRPISLINLLVGVNNSGKSRLMRSVFALKKFEFNTEDSPIEEYRAICRWISEGLNHLFPNATSIGRLKSDEVQNTLKQNFDFFDPEYKQLVEITNIIDSLSSLRNDSIIEGMHWRRGLDSQTAGQLRQLTDQAKLRLANVNRPGLNCSEKRFYLPILRGMRLFDEKRSDFYKIRTTEDYFAEAELSDNMQVFTGIELYQTLKRKLLGKPEGREQVRAFENYLSERFFQSRHVTLIPVEGQTTVEVQIGEDDQLEIHNLGDGLQSLIICTFNIFMEAERCLFFIEEPDICMHPGMQRAFLQVLSEHPQHQSFLTTHSNHLLDLAFDFSNISVFHFTKTTGISSRFKIKATGPGDRDLLMDLGVRNSSVFLTNATIWVEGITDRFYIREYMKKFLIELATSESETDRQNANKWRALREDTHYSFVEYQGSTLTHWRFDAGNDAAKIKAPFLCAHALVIADGDVTEKGRRMPEYSAMLGERFHAIPVKEIENLIPEEILRLLVEDEFVKRQKDVGTVKYQKYAKYNVKIGQYLDRTLGLENQTRVFGDRSGTVKNKTKFCERAVRMMGELPERWRLTPELNDLCTHIFRHIWTENNR